MEQNESKKQSLLGLHAFARLYNELLQLSELSSENVPYCKEILSIIAEADFDGATPVTDLNEYFNYLLDETEASGDEQDEYIHLQKAHFRDNVLAFIDANSPSE